MAIFLGLSLAGGRHRDRISSRQKRLICHQDSVQDSVRERTCVHSSRRGTGRIQLACLPSSGSDHPWRSPSQCWACATAALPGKKVCQTCFGELAYSRESEAREVRSGIRYAVAESLQHYVAVDPFTSRGFPGVTSKRLFRCRFPKERAVSASEDLDSVRFDSAFICFSEVPALIQAVKKAIVWEDEEVEVPLKSPA